MLTKIENRQSDKDMMKGIGIFLMIFSHTSFLSLINCINYINAFYMPMFFVVSGLFFNYEKYSVKEIIKKRGKQLLLPYIFWSLIQGILYIIMYYMGMNIDHTPKQVILGIFQISSDGHFPLGMGFWFLLCLFEVNVFCVILFKYLPKMVCYFIILVLAVIELYAHIWLPFCMNNMLLANLFYIIGYTIKKFTDKYNQYVYNWLVFFLIVPYIFLVNFNGVCGFAGGFYGRYPILYVFTAIVGTFLGGGICSYLVNWKGLEKILSWYGRNTMPLLCMNGLTIAVLKKIIPQNSVVFIFVESILVIVLITAFSLIVRKIDRSGKIYKMMFG